MTTYTAVAVAPGFKWWRQAASSQPALRNKPIFGHRRPAPKSPRTKQTHFRTTVCVRLASGAAAPLRAPPRCPEHAPHRTTQANRVQV